MKTNKIIIISILILFIAVLVFHINTKAPKGANLNYNKIRHIETVDDTRIFYSCLDEYDKALYELFLNLVKNKSVEGYTATVEISTEAFNKLTYDHFWNVYYAMVYDYPEYFFLLTGEESRISAYDHEAGDITVLTFELSPEPEYEAEEIAKFEEAAERFLSEIDLTAPKSEIELQIHDKLIDEVEYNYELYETDYESTYPEEATAYGALVSHLALCSGYAAAFQYLLQRSGIPCSYISGTAYYDYELEEKADDKGFFHAWNLVELDGTYYEVDTTWDDSETGQHDYYNLTTKEIEQINDSHHYRGLNESLDTDGISIYLNNLLPEALGEAG